MQNKTPKFQVVKSVSPMEIDQVLPEICPTQFLLYS